MIFYYFLINMIDIASMMVTFQAGQYADSAITPTCKNSLTYTRVIQFAQSFVNVPQLAVYISYYDQYPGANTLLTTSGITQSQFQFSLFCLGQEQSSVRLEWIAVDDIRFLLINIFNQDVTSQDQLFTVPHSDPTHTQGFVGLASYSFLGDINFTLSLQSLTTTDVTVRFTQANKNVFKLGFFLILGTADAFTIGPQRINKTMNWASAQVYTYPILIPYNYKFLTVFQQVIYTQVPYSGFFKEDFRLKIFQMVKNDSTIKYTVTPWQYTVITQAMVQEIKIATGCPIYLPSFCVKLRCSRKLQPILLKYPIQMKVVELNNQIITSSQQIILGPTIQSSTIVITFQCYLSTYVNAQLLKCLNCANLFQIYKQQCYARINLIELHIKLYQQDQVQQIFQIDITKNRLAITHLVQNMLGSVSYSVAIVSLEQV